MSAREAQTLVPLQVRAQGGHTHPASAQVRGLSPMARLRRAAKSAGILLGLALAVSPIPPIHWVLVPAFLIAAVVTFLVRMTTGDLATAEITCPKCQQSFAMEEQPPKWPLELTCHHCRAGLTVSPQPEAGL